MPTPLSSDERGNLGQLLFEAQARADAGDYTAATDFIRQARETDPENIYILAFEKQVEQLTLLSASKALTEESRGDILESLGGIIDRIVGGGPESGAPGAGAPSAPSGATREDRAAAMEWLKSQYFQQAHHYVRKGEYDHALAEIRRVFIIEPVNETARQFESHILELKELHQLVPEEGATSGPPPMAPPSPLITPTKPAAVIESGQDEEEPAPERRRSGTLIVSIIAIAMAFIGFALIYNWVRSTEVKQEPPPVVIPQPEVYFGDPAITTDTSKAPVAGAQPTSPSLEPGRTDTTELPPVQSEPPDEGPPYQP